ncbi:MAG: YggS family pyridoxal phosphate-dependent enzyme [Gemmatimonadaceae bacterium]
MLYEDLAGRLTEVRERIAAAVARGGHGQLVTLIAVTKTHGPDAVHAAWNAGVRDVGENRVQEALPKMHAVTEPVRWHLIGHLQRNKVNAVDHFTLLHSMDSRRLAEAVHEHGVSRRQPVHVLLQLNVSGETSKGGFAPAEVGPVGEWLSGCPGITVQGVMTMAPLDASEAALRGIFAGARAAREKLCRLGHPAAELSMGMSGDYEVAVEEGATMVRLGTILFGARGT